METEIFICYCIVIILVTLGAREPSPGTKVSLNPVIVYQTVIQSALAGIKAGSFIEMLKRISWYTDALVRTGLNVLLFIPFGFLLPRTITFFGSLWKTLLTGFVVSLLIEALQLIFHLGWFDTSDLLHNTIGTVIGYGAYYRYYVGSYTSKPK